MRVLQINSVCGQGSTGRIAVDLYHEIINRGYECCIAYGRGNAPPDIQSYKIGNNRDVYFHALMSRLTDRQGLYSIAATRKFVKWIQSYKPDIIHIHNIHGYYLNYKILFEYLAKADIPVIWTFHDCWPFTGHCACFDYVGCDQWQIKCSHCPQIDSYPKSWVVDNSERNFELKRQVFTSLKKLTIITPSQWLAKLVKKSFLHNYEVVVIHNGIDTKIFKPTPSNFRVKYHLEGKNIILGVANIWTDRKGYQDFIRLSKMIDNKSSTIVLVGVSKKQIKELPSNVIGIERTQNITELAEIYSAADVFFNPTYEDNYPTVNLESQACGTPVITYNTGGCSETIEKNNNAIINKSDLNEIIHDLSIIRNKKAIDSFRLRSYSKSDMCQEYIKLINNKLFRLNNLNI